MIKSVLFEHELMFKEKIGRIYKNVLYNINVKSEIETVIDILESAYGYFYNIHEVRQYMDSRSHHKAKNRYELLKALEKIYLSSLTKKDNLPLFSDAYKVLNYFTD